jgi:hypothetical protein
MSNDRRRRKNRPAGGKPADATVADKIASMLEFVRATDDVETLNAVRAEFRQAVPLHLRAYVAAALLMDATGGLGRRRFAKDKAIERRPGEPRAPEGREQREPEASRKQGVDIRFTQASPSDARRQADEDAPRKREDRRREEPKRGDARKAERKEGGERESDADRKPRAEYKGEPATLFFGMGKRQHLYPRIVFKMLEGAGLGPAQVADVRSFDNYTFVGVDPDFADKAIQLLNGTEFRGRTLTVGPARRKEGERDENGDAPVNTAPYDETFADRLDEEGGAGEPSDGDARSAETAESDTSPSDSSGYAVSAADGDAPANEGDDSEL